jgi:hypothetical protein
MGGVFAAFTYITNDMIDESGGALRTGAAVARWTAQQVVVSFAGVQPLV